MKQEAKALARYRMRRARETFKDGLLSGVIKLFSQHFVKSGLILAATAKVLSRSFEKRLDSEYEDYVSFSKEEAENVRDEVQEFIQACEDTLAKVK